MKILTSRQRAFAFALGATLAAVLLTGFLPTAQGFYQWATRSWAELHPGLAQVVQLGVFPCLAAVFCFSLGLRHTPGAHRASASALWLSAGLPVAVAFVYGTFSSHPALFSEAMRWSVAWLLFCAPLGEELLFRGWVYEIGDRVWPQGYLTATNPLPVSVWMSALAFALWHLQNLPYLGGWRTGFQVLYTLLTGLWLGYLRWQTGSVAPCFLAHSALNLAANLG